MLGPVLSSDSHKTSEATSIPPGKGKNKEGKMRENIGELGKVRGGTVSTSTKVQCSDIQ